MERTTDPQERLRAAIGFSDYELAENREGRLAAIQKIELERASQRQSGIVGLVMIANAVLLVVLLSTPAPFGWLNGVCIGFLVVLFSLTVLSGRAEKRQEQNDRDAGAVSVVEGAARTEVLPGGGEDGPNLQVTIGRYTFRWLSERVFNAFETGQHYRVYHLRGRILAAEVMTHAKSEPTI